MLPQQIFAVVVAVRCPDNGMNVLAVWTIGPSGNPQIGRRLVIEFDQDRRAMNAVIENAGGFRSADPGKVGVIHWKSDEETPRGPSFSIRPRPEQCREWAERSRFRFVRDEELCCCSWHWGMVLEKPGV